MVFQQPAFLWALWALLIPVIIHLFDFRKNKKVFFPDIRFLKQVKHSAKKPLRLKHWLILLSRLGFILFLVLAFAQPVLKTTNQQQLSRGVKVIYIDNSPSMLAPVVTGESALVQGKQLAATMLENMPRGQEVLVLTNTNLTNYQLSNSLHVAGQQVAGIMPGSKAFNWPGLYRAIKNYQKQSSLLVSDVFVFSDFQQSNFKNLTQLPADTTQAYWLVPNRPATLTNAVVDTVFMLPQKVTNPAVNLAVVVQNTGAETLDNLPVKVYLGNRQVSATTVTLQAFQKKEITFNVGSVRQAQPGYVLLDDTPNTFDNRFYFTLRPAHKWHIFSIDGESPSPYLKHVFGNTQLFDWSSSFYKNVEENQLEQADMVVLNQVARPNNQLITQLKLFAANGGVVLVVPAPNLDIAAFKAIHSALAKSIAQQPQMMETPSVEHPFFKAFLEGSSQTMAMPQATPVWSWGTDRSALLKFEDGTPFLSEISSNLYLMASPLVDSLSGFATHALFVPVMYRLAAQASHPEEALYYRTNDDFFDINPDSLEVRDILKLQADDVEIVPEKRKQGHHWRISFPTSMRKPGNYTMQTTSGVVGYLPLNLPASESALAGYTPEELTNILAGFKVHVLDDYVAGKNILSAFAQGFSLWKYALIISLLFLLLESLFIRLL